MTRGGSQDGMSPGEDSVARPFDFPQNPRSGTRQEVEIPDLSQKTLQGVGHHSIKAGPPEPANEAVTSVTLLASWAGG